MSDKSAAQEQSVRLQEFEETIPAYLEHLRVRNYSPQTIQSQTKQLVIFTRFCEAAQLVRADQVTRKLILEFQNYLHNYQKRRGGGLAASTQRQWLTTVTSFFGWLSRKDALSVNPATDLEMPRTEFRLPRTVLSAREVERILAVPNTDSAFGLRDRAILEVFYSSGIRRNELCRLNLTDIDFDRGVLRVEQGKGRKDRFVPIGSRALLWVERYLTRSRPKLGKIVDSAAMFLGKEGRRVHPGRLASHIHGLVDRARLGKKGSCHLFRHAFATALLENGCDLRHIQAMLGHAKLETTAIYTHLNMHDLKAAHVKYHPAKLGSRDKRGPTSAKDQLMFAFMVE
jgi:integrase/recombinase XerD